jgi:MoaA/NifB/PqqE/SkfB family radical SAM enzyme
MLPGLLNMRRPSFVLLFVTSRCNARCSFCFYAENINDLHKDNELTAEEYLSISKSAGHIPYLLISGGEPVLRDDLAEIIGYFVENASSKFITIPSNGLSPEKTFRLFETLTSRYPKTHFRAAFSLDYPDERHDRVRGVKGCRESLLEAARRIAVLRAGRTNLSMDLVTVFIDQSAEDLKNLREFADHNIHPNNHELHILRSDAPGGAVDSVDVNLFLNELTVFGEKGRVKETRALSAIFRGINNTFLRTMKHLCRGIWTGPCRAGSKFTVIDECGKVRLCEIRDDVLGDLRENGYSLMKILHSESSLKTIRDMNKDRCTCTWECAMSTNIIFNPRFYPELIYRTLRELCTRRKSQ